MERQDKGLAFMLQYENVAWFDGREVRILDRRVYPAKVEFVTCRTHQEVTQAIADMVTQSAGPFTACAMGMALAAWECRDRSGAEQLTYLKQAAHTLSHARPTTVGRMELITGGCLAAAEACLAGGRRSLMALLDRVQVRSVTPEELPGFDLTRIFTNVNTPEDYERLFREENK